MDRYRVEPGSKFRIADRDPGDTSLAPDGREPVRNRTEKLTARLGRLQALMYAEHKHKLLIVLQGMDTSGKDGTIRSVFDGVNPTGVRVASFKVPSPYELDHDYLWRIHHQVPARGEMVIFNRSHYEDVLVVRVHEIVPPKVWKKRFDQINDFERMLTDNGTTILKFFLHIDKAEQRKRLQARIDDPKANWKYNSGDLTERALWDSYATAYEDMLKKTSTEWAPWYVVPGNAKWYRNLVVSTVIVEAMKALEMTFPPPGEGIVGTVVE